jgi:hypothetical protein
VESSTTKLRAFVLLVLRARREDKSEPERVTVFLHRCASCHCGSLCLFLGFVLLLQFAWFDVCVCVCVGSCGAVVDREVWLRRLCERENRGYLW